MESMYQYYERQAVLPTFADFRDEAALSGYERARRRLFLDKLFVPPRFFSGADVLQYGPDSGEDALVFARWGATLTLVEPNPRACEVVQTYFARFNLESRLEDLVKSDVEGYKSNRRFDFIDAEGFIYTVRPISVWLSRFHEYLVEDGLFLITYYETTGAFIELCTKAFYRAARALNPASSPVEAAESLYRSKWASIPHTRAFESWVMDIMENPFVRRRFFLTATKLCEEAAKHGFELYSSWPTYHDALQIYWHKHYPEYADLREMSRRHIARSVLSFLTGQMLYFVDDDFARIAELSDRLDRAGEAVDHLAGDYDARICSDAAEMLEGIHAMVARLRTRAEEARRAEALDLLESLGRAFRLAAAGDLKGLCSLTNSDAAFIRNWGLPSHPVVFRRTAKSL
jgi:hypothetical protein